MRTFYHGKSPNLKKYRYPHTQQKSNEEKQKDEIDFSDECEKILTGADSKEKSA